MKLIYVKRPDNLTRPQCTYTYRNEHLFAVTLKINWIRASFVLRSFGGKRLKLFNRMLSVCDSLLKLYKAFRTHAHERKKSTRSARRSLNWKSPEQKHYINWKNGFRFLEKIEWKCENRMYRTICRVFCDHSDSPPPSFYCLWLFSICELAFRNKTMGRIH